MKYAQHRSQISKKRSVHSKKARLWLAVITVIILFFAIGIFLRSNSSTDGVSVELNEAIVEIVEEKTVVGEIEKDDEIEQITLIFVGAEGEGSGIARRGVSGTLFTHVVVAELPSIDTSTHFYEGWLVKPGVTDFFSTGDMFSRADGMWGLVWESELSEMDGDINDYEKVVITLEPRDGDPAPAPEHVLEGSF